MTEAEWLACEDPAVLIAAALRVANRRKRRLIACGCCRLVWDWLTDERSRRTVETSERFADGLATDEELQKAAWLGEAAVFALDAKVARHQREQKAIRDGWLDAEEAIETGFVPALSGAPVPLATAREMASDAEDTAYAELSIESWHQTLTVCSLTVLRDVFGNPFRPVAPNLAWLTSDVLALAQGIYDDHAFDRLPILADALQDAGCDNGDILTHCRDTHATHVRGCWVIDLLLGKA